MTRFIPSILLSATLASGIYAQPLFNNGLIAVDGALISVKDSLVNNGTLINNGKIAVTGSWLNAGTYTAGTGEIVLDGTAAQRVDHRGQPMARLTITGGGDKQLASGLVVQKQLNLGDGLLLLLQGDGLGLIEGAAVAGGSKDSHIVGPVTWRGRGTWLFPVGNGTEYLPVAITGVTDPAAEAILHESDCAENNWEVDPVLSSVSGRRYWALDITQGTLQNSRIALPLLDDDNLADDPSLLVVSWAANLPGPFTSLGRASGDGNRSSGWVMSATSPGNGYYMVGASATESTSLEVFNALSVNNDNMNEFMRIKNIERYPNNTVSIFNRWGDRVFEMRSYNNIDRIFTGESNMPQNALLPPATYFYKIDPGDGGKIITGYLVLRR